MTKPSTLTRRAVHRLGALALAGAATPLAACASGAAQIAPKAVNVPVTISFGTDWSSGPRGDIMKQALASFAQQRPTITVDRHDIGNDYYTKLAADFAAGTQDDVILFDGPVFDQFRKQNAFVDLTPLLKAAKVDVNSYTRADPVFAPEGKRYALPFQLTYGIWLVNKTLFGQAGLKLPAESWTWNDWADAAKALTNPDKGQYGLGPTLNNNLQVSVLPLILSNGGHHISADFKQTMLAAPEATEAIRWVADRIVRERSWVPYGDKTGTFANGNVAMAFANTGAIGSSASGMVQSLRDKFDWDLMPQPKAPRAGKSLTNFNEQPHVLTAKQGGPAGRVDAGFALLLHMAGKDVQTLIARLRGSTPVLRELVNGSPYTDAPPATMSLVGRSIDSAVETRFFAGYLEWRDEYAKPLADIWSGKVSVETGVQQAVQAGNAVLAKYR